MAQLSLQPLGAALAISYEPASKFPPRARVDWMATFTALTGPPIGAGVKGRGRVVGDRAAGAKQREAGVLRYGLTMAAYPPFFTAAASFQQIFPHWAVSAGMTLASP